LRHFFSSTGRGSRVAAPFGFDDSLGELPADRREPRKLAFHLLGVAGERLPASAGWANDILSFVSSSWQGLEERPRTVSPLVSFGEDCPNLGGGFPEIGSVFPHFGEELPYSGEEVP
jgi:hypothetical protein